MSPNKQNFSKFSKQNCSGNTSKHPSGYRNDPYDGSLVTFLNNSSHKSSPFFSTSPIRNLNLQEKNKRHAQCFQNDFFSRSLKRKLLDKRRENNCFSFPFVKRNQTLTKSSNGLISELCYEVISPKNTKRKRDFEEQDNKDINFFHESINLNVGSLNINNSSELDDVDQMMMENDTIPRTWNETSFASKNHEILLPDYKTTNGGTYSEFFPPNNDENNCDSDEGSIIQVLSPVKIKNIPCLFNIEGINNLRDDKGNMENKENLNLHMSQSNLKIPSYDNINFSSPQSDDRNFCENNESLVDFLKIKNNEDSMKTTIRNTLSCITDDDNIVPETQFSSYFGQRSPSPEERVQCFFEPPSQIFNGDHNQLKINLRNVNLLYNTNNQRRGRPPKRLKLRQDYKWSWLHDSFTDYLNKNYCDIQRQKHDMIVNPDLCRLEISLIGSFPIWGMIFFKPCKYNIEESIAVICSSLNVPKIKLNREYIFKIYPQYNFVVYSPYKKVIINPINDVF